MSAQRPGRRFPRAWPVINVIRSQYPEAPAPVVAWAVAHGADYRSAISDCRDTRALRTLVVHLLIRAMRAEGDEARELLARVFEAGGYEVDREALTVEDMLRSGRTRERLDVDEIRARIPLDALLARAGLA